MGGPYVLSPHDWEIRPAMWPVKKCEQAERKGEGTMKRKEEKAKGKKIPRKIERGWVDPMATPMDIA